MKCKSCARGYSRLLRTCPFCGTPSADNVLYPNGIAKFLARPRDIGNLCVTNMNILFVFAINLSIAALVVNLFTFKASDNLLWCHYVICAAFGLYGVLRGSFGSKVTALRTVRDATLVSIIALAVTAIAYNLTDKNERALNIVQYAIPIVVICLCVVALLFLFLGLANSISFAITTSINTGISTALLIVSLVSESFDSPTLIYVAFGSSVFILSNYLLLFGLSFMTKVKRGF